MKVYEVIRIIDKSVIFLNEHIDRFIKSINHYSKYEIDINTVKEEINRIIKNKKEPQFNIRFSFDIKDKTFHFESFVGNYPSKEEYINGVSLLTYNHTRLNPNVKVEVKELREKVNLYLKKHSKYEALYIDEQNVFEGSRSNVFFIKDDVIYTTADELVLSGITRLKVIELIEKLKIKVVKRKIKVSELKDFDSTFITGTSINILPVNFIDNISYNVNNKILRTIMNEFEKEIK